MAKYPIYEIQPEKISQITKQNNIVTNVIDTVSYDDRQQLSNPNINLIKILFDFTYYLCLTPFKFKFNTQIKVENQSQTYARIECPVKRHFNRVQQVNITLAISEMLGIINFELNYKMFHYCLFTQFMCAISHILMIFQYFTEARILSYSLWKHPTTAKNPHPSAYFRLIADAAKILFKLVFIKTLWTNGHSILEMINFTEDNRHFQVFRYKCWVS